MAAPIPMSPFPDLLRRIALVLVLATAWIGGPAQAQDAPLQDLLSRLAGADFAETARVVEALAATGDPAAAPILEALGEGDLFYRRSDNAVFIATRGGKGYLLSDPLTGEAAGEAGRREVAKVRVNNSLRRAVRAAIGTLTLRSPDPDIRRAAAETVLKSRDPEAIDPLTAAIEVEADAGVRFVMERARAAATLNSGADDAAKIDAVATIAAKSDQEARSILLAATDGASDSLRQVLDEAVTAVERDLAMWSAAQNVWYGLSLGSVLLLAAIGLAITFGVMGVINMAHGEMVMIGAYVTFVVQEIIRNHAPGLFDASLLIALPLAFATAGLVGMAIERGIIRFLYGRPLETLLATWGLSLILQQAVRSLFGPTNQEVGAPSWMSGAFELGGLTLTYGRVWIIVFALIVFAVLILVLRHTSFGLQMRAVTQNRRMASSMGIRTNWTDALTFGLGSGIAGVAGVALSQIDNVSPNLGQSYIIDSFLVVVFGGVGNLWGTLVGALSLGVLNKFLEPYTGAVLGKILVLVFIILFIQKRPRGLFALKGRAVE
ncbi:MAG: urea ABC transporter permease subunit UrtB [Thalassobaculaceae bacterium]|uniref:urea ABC transporter permease subunit UrtB n=1 Tax=Roseitalea porphyridii TaxID=1852022 RepID=UPI0032EC5B01